MKFCLLPLLLAPVLGVAGFATAAESREEAFLIFENRKLSMLVPAGFESVMAKDESGWVAAIRFSEPKDRSSLEIRFVPDPEKRQMQARARRELMNEVFGEYVRASTEKGMQFEELEPRAGVGTYCVFTDSSLVGRTDLPPGEYLHVTAGLKAWPGVVVIFRFFSNDTDSPGYQAIMKMLRESLQEKSVPLL
jgi:hypothetical protein